jgi:acyl transferase domain-containing protein
LLESVGRLWLAGVEIDWRAFQDGERRRRIPLPTYPFERERYWLEGGERRSGSSQPAPARSPGRKADIADWFEVPSWKRQAMPQAPAPDTTPGGNRCWLMFADARGLAQQLGERLAARGDRVFMVRPGTDYSHHEREFTLSPGEPSHYASAVEALRRAGHTLG